MRGRDAHHGGGIQLRGHTVHLSPRLGTELIKLELLRASLHAPREQESSRRCRGEGGEDTPAVLVVSCLSVLDAAALMLTRTENAVSVWAHYGPLIHLGGNPGTPWAGA